MTSYLRHLYQVAIYDKKHSDDDKLWKFGVDQFPYVTGVSVRTEAENMTSDSISISFDAPFEVGKSMLSSTMFAHGNLVQARVGYIDGGAGGSPRMSPWFYGWLDKGGEGLSMSPTGMSGTITATGKGRGSFFDEIHSNVTYEQGLRELFALNNWAFAPDADQLSVLSKLKSMRVSRLLTADEFVDELGSLMDVRIIDDPRETSSGNAVKRLESTTKVLAGRTKYKFVMRGSFDRANDTYPLLSFSSSISQAHFTFKRAASEAATSGGINKRGETFTHTKRPKDSEQAQGNTTNESPEGGSEAPVPGESTTQAGLQNRPADNPRQKMAFFADRAVGDLDEQTVEVVTQSLCDQAVLLDGLQGKVELMGLPEVAPYEMCQIVNLGSLFDGAYLITAVEHSANATEFKTTLDVAARSEGSTGGKNPDAQPEAKATNAG